MDLMRIWPTRYCPRCGSAVLRANNPTEHDERLAILVCTGELPVWIGLFIGLAVSGIVGRSLGFLAGALVALGLVIVWIAVILKLETRKLRCWCKECGTVSKFEETLSRKQRDEGK